MKQKGYLFNETREGKTSCLVLPQTHIHVMGAATPSIQYTMAVTEMHVRMPTVYILKVKARRMKNFSDVKVLDGPV